MLLPCSIRAFFLLLLLGWVHALPLHAQQRGIEAHRAESRYFIVTAPDPISASYVASLGDEMGEFARRFFPLGPQAEVPVRIRLIPRESEGWTGITQVRVDAAGSVILDFPYRRELERRSLIASMAQALLLRITIDRFGLEQAAQMPLWVEAGFSARFETHLRRQMRKHFRRTAQAIPAMTLETLFSTGRPANDPNRLLVNAYLFWEGVEGAVPDALERRLFFSKALAGEAPDSLLRQTGRAPFQSLADRRLWWAATYSGAASGSLGPLETMAQTRLRVEQLIQMQVLVDGRELTAGVAELWEYRKQPAVRQALEERLEAIKASAVRANPVFQASLLRLGEVIEAMLADDRAAFEQRAQLFLQEVASSEALAVSIRRVLAGIELGD